jgi:hypothetical protein
MRSDDDAQAGGAPDQIVRPTRGAEFTPMVLALLGIER